MASSADNIEEVVNQWITPNWPAPSHVRAYVTTRAGNYNGAPFNGFNTADHVGDKLEVVKRNRVILQKHFGWSAQPYWLNQVHGTNVLRGGRDHTPPSSSDADACVTNELNIPCAIHTADCLPVFFTNQQGTQVALAHAGWRGLLDGVLENTLASFGGDDLVYAWLGPAISQKHFEVGEEVFQQFIHCDASASQAFTASGSGKYLCDLYAIARQRLLSDGRCSVYGGEFCTYSDARFFSYRQAPVTGRLLSLLWIDLSQ